MNQPVLNTIFSKQKRPWLLVLLLAIGINAAGIATDFFTNDPGLYALLAKNMVQSHNYTDLVYRGHDWLDKPHFPFWMVAISFNVFGINTVAYKLPALLFFFMGVAYTYKLAKKLYDAETALIAALILLTCEHLIMSNTDVRAEPYILGLLMGSVYHFYGLKVKFGLKDLFIGALFAACAVMTKGIYVLIPIGSAIIGDYLFKRNFKGMLQWRWLFAVVLTGVFMLPEIYTLYIQFDIHPEKVVFQHQNVSGIHWFLWDSQFGRFNDTGFITRAEHDYFFFLHTLLWAFAPWAILFYAALFFLLRNMVKGVRLPEYVCICGGGLMFLIFSVSQFQLPFYTNILFPFFAVITAVDVKRVFTAGKGRFFKTAQYVFIAALVILIAFVDYVFAPGNAAVFMVSGLALTLFARYIFKTQKNVEAIFLLSCAVAIWANFYVVMVVYPCLVHYKGDVQAAAYINQSVNPDKKVVAAFEAPDPFEFYTHRKVGFISPAELLVLADTRKLVLVEDSLLVLLNHHHIAYHITAKFDNYPNEVLMRPFLIEKERPSSLNHFFLITIGPQNIGK